MDTLRGNFSDHAGYGEDLPDYELSEDEAVREAPPGPVGQDERRMQVRAYNHWASLLDGRVFPSIEDLEPEALPDFGPFSVLLDFSQGIENPSIRFLGDKLAEECGAESAIESLSDVPSRSLLSRITDHYMQILANQAPIGFEAEFVNQREKTILYRGILLPFSSDDDTIDFIYGVINWKELADQKTTDALLLEIDQALETGPAGDPRREDEMTDWADGPAEIHGEDDDVLELGDLAEPAQNDFDLPTPAFGGLAAPEAGEEFVAEAQLPDSYAGIDAEAMGLADWLAAAREMAEAARGSEDRTRQALYAAIGRAYDFSLAAAEAPEEFAELVNDAGLTVQDRAPMTPVVKLVFGAEYDKTRLTEYATALGHAQRIGLARGELARYLGAAPGGLKGIVSEERRHKRGDTSEVAAPRDTPREALARKLRKLECFPMDAVPAEGAEFSLLVARRLPNGEVVLLGEVADDVPLLERAARRLLG
jgi:hypothetical protein